MGWNCAFLQDAQPAAQDYLCFTMRAHAPQKVLRNRVRKGRWGPSQRAQPTLTHSSGVPARQQQLFCPLWTTVWCFQSEPIPWFCRAGLHPFPPVLGPQQQTLKYCL